MARIRSLLLLLPLIALGGCSAIVDTSLFTYGAITPNAGPDQIVPPSSMVTLDASGSTQSAGKPLTFLWEQTMGPTVMLANPDTAKPTFTAPGMKTHLEFLVHVKDGAPGEKTDTVAVDVDSTPTVTAGPDLDRMTVRTVFLDATNSFDADDEPLTFTWTQTAGAPVTLTDANMPLASFVSPINKGTFTFHVVACDALNVCGSDDVIVRVHRWQQIVAGYYHILGLRSDGAVFAWGSNWNGELGAPLRRWSLDSPHPVQVEGLSNVTSIPSVGYGTSTARTMAGTTYAWGNNCNGEAGYATAVPGTCDNVRSATALDPGYQTNIGIARTYQTALYIASGGTSITGVGWNYYGSLGNCTTLLNANASPPISIAPPPSTTWTAVYFPKTSAPLFGMAMASDGYVYPWGENTYGNFGTGAAASATCATPSASTSLGVWQPKSISLGANHGAAVDGSGYLRSWGYRQLDGGTTSSSYVLYPNYRGNNIDWTTVASGYVHSLAVRANGWLYSWGAGGSGQLGLGNTNDSWPAVNADPARVGTDSDWSQVAASAWSSFALKTDGTAWSWGSADPALGSGYLPTASVQTPTRIVDDVARCGDGIVSSGYDNWFWLTHTEICDDGLRNGTTGHCSPSCRCPSTRVVYVNGTATGTNDGTSWTNAYTSIQSAIDAAGVCDTIWVARGTYTSATATAPVITMAAGTEIYGGFAGYEVTFAQRDPARNPTILDGRGTSYHVVVGGDGGTIDGLTIKGGHANGTTPDDSGGGLLLNASGTAEFALRNVAFVSNTSANKGGGLYTVSTGGTRRNVILHRVRFESNTSVAGGGLANSGANVYAVTSFFYGNHADDTTTAANGMGGGVYDDGTGYLRMPNAQFIANEASGNGGAIWFSGNPGLSVMTAYGNTGPGSVIYSSNAGIGIDLTAMWNPAAGSETTNIVSNYGCFSASGVPAGGTGNVTTMTNPFQVTGTGGGMRAFLSSTSACRDAGDPASMGYDFPDYSLGSTTMDGSLDVGVPDIGYHYMP